MSETMISQDFCRAVAHFTVILLAVFGLAAVALGFLLLLFPVFVLQILLYILGGIAILFGIGALGSLLCALLRTKR